MKTKLAVIVLIGLGWNSQTYAFEGETHKALTQKAISNNNQSILDNYLKDRLSIEQGLNRVLLLDETITPDADRVLPHVPPNPSVLDLLKAGADLEDIPLPRARHHFHDPTRNGGLDNKTEHPARAPAINWVSERIWGLSFDLTGSSALERAMGTEGSQWETEYENYFAWPDARNYFYEALTNESEDVREHYLALTFLALGHVLHLLEDMGVPPHARNDFVEAHFRVPAGMWGNPFESHVEDETGTSGIPTRWLTGWTPQAKVYDKVSKYWDTDVYDGNYVGATPIPTWGLSEQTNYQFLSKSTIFRENDGTKYYFPHPDPCRVGEHTDSSLWYKRRYVSGYDITHLARTKYIEQYAYMAGMPVHTGTVAYHTTFDEAVYEDYAKVTIRRAIDYPTGLANYFFRGILEVDVQGAETAGVVQIAITNKSMNSSIGQALKGGDFELYAYCIDGQAAPVELTLSGWSHGILAYDDSLTGTFEVPALSSLIAYYGVVYKGQIVPDANTAHIDPDDPNAIAFGKTATRAILYFGNCSEWYEDNPSWFDDDLAAFRSSCNNFKVGFYYTPRQWFDDPCPYCCTYSIADVIPAGYDFPEEIYFETLTEIPATSSDINNYIYNLVGGATPQILVIIHHDSETMYYTEADWTAWLSNPLRNNPQYPYPGPGGILRNALIDWVNNYVPNGYTTAYLLRHPDDTWLWVVTDIIQQLNQ